jgi:hypothetical protein
MMPYPSRHPVEQDGPLRHPRHGGDADMLVSVVDDARVDFIGEDHQVVCDAHLGDLFEQVAAEDPAGGVLR